MECTLTFVPHVQAVNFMTFLPSFQFHSVIVHLIGRFIK